MGTGREDASGQCRTENGPVLKCYSLALLSFG